MSGASAGTGRLAGSASLLLVFALLAGPSGPARGVDVAFAAAIQTAAGSETNYALEFDGSGAMVDLSAMPIGGPASVTIEVWARMDEADRLQFLVTNAESDFNDGFALFITGSNRVGFVVASSVFAKAVAIGATELEVDEWYHLAASFDPQLGSVKVFVNGVEDGSVAYAGAIRYLEGRDLLLATQRKSFMRRMRYFRGALDEIRIWGYSRRPAELHATMEYELAGDEPGLLGYWPLNEGEGRKTEDASPADNPGDLVNGPEWIEAPWRKNLERLVTIDVKPEDSENVIPTHSRGKIPVALLSSNDFDAVEEVDRATLTFGRTGSEESLDRRGRGRTHCAVDDVNADGRRDLICMFETLKTSLEPGDEKAILRGATMDATTLRGEDAIRAVRRGRDRD